MYLKIKTYIKPTDNKSLYKKIHAVTLCGFIGEESFTGDIMLPLNTLEFSDDIYSL